MSILNLAPTNRRSIKLRASLLVASALLVPLTATSYVRSKTPLPAEFDVRGIYGVPRGLANVLIQPTQIKAITALRTAIGQAPLKIEYNGLTATPIKLFNPQGYLTEPSQAQPEIIARQFVADHADLFRFSGQDLSSLRLRTRATTADTGTTILVFEQQLGGVPIYGGDVLVNVTKSGQIANVGDQSFPQVQLNNSFVLSPSQAVSLAGSSLSLGVSPQASGVRQVLSTFGNLPQQHVSVDTFTAKPLASNLIAVSRVVFPLAEGIGRAAYKFTMTTPSIQGVTWEFVVDAASGAVLRRTSLTRFDNPGGGGTGKGRKATFRPDIQDRVEHMNDAHTALGKVFDPYPVAMSGDQAFGRGTRTGTAPNYIFTAPKYAADTASTVATGRGFKYSLVKGRIEGGLPFDDTSVAGAVPESIPVAALPAKIGQVTRGLPDAKNPSAESPFGWFYLPTDTGGAEIATANSNRDATRAYGYGMAPEAMTRNKVNPGNSPNGLSTGDQPFSVTATTLPASVKLLDGRTMTSVLESNYTEGNNMISSDDNNNDDETTQGIRGYSANRQFTAPYFDYTLAYEFGGTDASSPPFPVGANADVYPGAMSLFFINNLFHDYLYSIGFTEEFWNFQQDNFGKGGAGSDAVLVQVQDGSGTDNANMSTGDDGDHSTMQMYLFTDGGFRRSDGDFDWDVIAHEHQHGVSGRSAAKGSGSCLGLALTGEPGGQNEGWSDYMASSMVDDEGEGEYVTGDYDIGIRRSSYSNYRYSYQSLTGAVYTRRDQALPPDQIPLGVIPIPFEVHDVGEIWAATLWDMREMIINKDPGAVFFDDGRLGSGTPFYIGDRLVNSVDADHPITYRASFGDTADDVIDGTVPTVNAARHIKRPALLAAEIASRNGDRHGPLASAVANGAKLSDRLVLRGLQLGYCQPSLIDSRDSILQADTELTGGENRAVIWRAIASHGMGAQAISSTQGVLDDTGALSQAGVVIEDFSVPAAVTTCETTGPLPSPAFALSKVSDTSTLVTINNGTSVTGANHYVITRGESPTGPFATIATPTATSYTDTGLTAGKAYYYQVRSARDASGDCTSQYKVAAQSLTAVVVTPPVTPTTPTPTSPAPVPASPGVILPAPVGGNTLGATAESGRFGGSMGLGLLPLLFALRRRKAR